MRYGLRILVALSLVVAGTVPALADASLSAVVGWRTLFHQSEWEPLDQQNEIGIMFDAGKATSPVRVDVAYHVSKERSSTASESCMGNESTHVRMTEGSVGALRYFRSGAGRTRPYVGGGGAIIGVNAHDVCREGTSFALYGRGGALWRVGSRFSLGIDSRLLLGSHIKYLSRYEVVADYIQIGAIVRWEFQ